jgi:hypothetical protein
MDRNSGPKSGEQANTYFQISDRSATDAGGGAASNVPDREDCRAPTPRFNEDALKEVSSRTSIFVKLCESPSSYS